MESKHLSFFFFFWTKYPSAQAWGWARKLTVGPGDQEQGAALQGRGLHTPEGYVEEKEA